MEEAIRSKVKVITQFRNFVHVFDKKVREVYADWGVWKFFQTVMEIFVSWFNCC